MSPSSRENLSVAAAALRAARWRTLRSEIWATTWRALVAMVPPPLMMLAVDHREYAALVALGALPGVALVIDHIARRAATRFDRYAQVLAHGDFGGGMALTSSIDDTRELALSLAVSARSDAELAEQERRAAVERERLRSEGMAALFQRRVYAEERAMAVLAAELHDTAVQSLTLARIAAQDGQPVSEVHAELMLAEKQLRGVLALTSPPELELGLADAVSKLLLEMRQQFELQVEVTGWPANSGVVLEQSTATTVYRFFQETLRNVVKHSGQLRAQLRLSEDNGCLLAETRDNGKGFDPRTVHPTAGHHVGLYLMDDRARAVGGELAISAAPGQGTSAQLRIPVAGLQPAETDTLAPERQQVGLRSVLDAVQ